MPTMPIVTIYFVAGGLYGYPVCATTCAFGCGLLLWADRGRTVRLVCPAFQAMVRTVRSLPNRAGNRDPRPAGGRLGGTGAPAEHGRRKKLPRRRDMPSADLFAQSGAGAASGAESAAPNMIGDFFGSLGGQSHILLPSFFVGATINSATGTFSFEQHRRATAAFWSFPSSAFYTSQGKTILIAANSAWPGTLCQRRPAAHIVESAPDRRQSVGTAIDPKRVPEFHRALQQRQRSARQSFQPLTNTRRSPPCTR